MIIKSNKIQEGLQGIEHVGDKTILTHTEDITPILEKSHQMRQDSNNGWTKDRSMRHIANIPRNVILQRPELLADKTGKLMKEFLRKEGESFLNVNKNSI
jgi:hypothetical protein